MKSEKLLNELLESRNFETAKILQKFFKTGKGEYGENDIFLGIKVPQIRTIIKKYIDMELYEIKELIQSPYHEVRMASVLILIEKMKKKVSEEIFRFYIDNAQYINNWDLVDISAPNIPGRYLYETKIVNNTKPDILYDFAISGDLWKKRISIVSTLYFIRKCHFQTTLDLVSILINDKNDLIQKATGWMLREIGKIDFDIEVNFLKNNYKNMGRTMLRYAIEKFNCELREKFLKGII